MKLRLALCIRVGNALKRLRICADSMGRSRERVSGGPDPSPPPPPLAGNSQLGYMLPLEYWYGQCLIIIARQRWPALFIKGMKFFKVHT